MVVQILYVDEDPGFRTLGKEFFEMNTSFLVDAVDSVESALTHLNDSIYDIIVSDYQMNNMSRINFFRQFRRIYPAIPFIFFPVWVMKKR